MMVSTRAVRRPSHRFSHHSQKATIPKTASPTKVHKTPRKKRAPRGSLLGSGGIGTGKSNTWTLQEREDLYKRRQNGEDWETICPVRFISDVSTDENTHLILGLSDAVTTCNAATIFSVYSMLLELLGLSLTQH